uniref:Ubiquinone biosynthesis protein n=1 Tax=Anopheles farauti TaxID=69004 RepID=A0A182R0C0_9DIPT
MDVLETVLTKLEAGDYKSALDVVANPDNEEAIKLQSMELISLTANNLTDDNAENKPELYSATETLLNRVAQKCSPPEVLYELMEKIRVTTSDDVFTSILKTIQVAVLRLPAKRARCLEWVLNTIIEYLDKISLPAVLDKDVDEKEEALLECEESFRRNILSSSRIINQPEPAKVLTATTGRYFGTSSPLQRANESFDDFRAREEKKEQEYAKQQQQTGDAMGTSSGTQTDTFSTTAHEQQSFDPEVERTKEMILDAALAFVQSHGWSKQAIASGAESINYPSVSHGLFPRGGIELVHHFYKQCNLKLIDYLKQQTADGEKVPNPSEFARKAIEFRLRLLEPYLKYWPQALGLMALPPNAPHSLANVLTLVDDICYYAGDRSVDFNWYTRRIGLACIYKTTELYMLQDSSAGFAKTWTFLERRMEEASLVHEFLVKSEDATHHLQNAVGSAFTTVEFRKNAHAWNELDANMDCLSFQARNILGLNFERR